jgi:hypothetical protein
MSSSGDPEYAALTVQRVGASRRRFETAAMDSTVRRELETLLGYMRACGRQPTRDRREPPRVRRCPIPPGTCGR